MRRDPLWEEIFTERAWGRYPSEDLVRFGAQRLGHRQPRSDVRVLEVGFGTGANLWYFAREGYSVAGLEGTETGWPKGLVPASIWRCLDGIAS